MEPCERCGRSLLDLRRHATRDALRGSAPLCPVTACPLVRRTLGFGGALGGPGGAGAGAAGRGAGAGPDAAGGGGGPRAGTRELAGPSPPAVFVGRHGYPRVSVGPLLPASAEAGPALSASPAEWAKAGGIAEVLAQRSRLYRSKEVVGVTPRARHLGDATHALEASQTLAMSARALDTEVTLAKPLGLLSPVRVDSHAAPMGPSVDVVDARVVGHPWVPRRVDALVSDVHADVATAATELYAAGTPDEHIQRLLSVGLLGEASRRRLVPTRWAITATDDTLGKALLERVRSHTLIDAPRVHRGSLFGNEFSVLLLPFAWQYEFVESWQEHGGWLAGRDAEDFRGRSGYVESTAGAYYAARLAVLEQLDRQRLQAAVCVYREITDAYWAPLGVWVVREAMRATMASKGLVFGEVAAALRHVDRFVGNADWQRVVQLPRELAAQRRLSDFN